MWFSFLNNNDNKIYFTFNMYILHLIYIILHSSLKKKKKKKCIMLLIKKKKNLVERSSQLNVFI